MVNITIPHLLPVLLFFLILPSICAIKKICSSNRPTPSDCPPDFQNMCAFFSSIPCDSKTCSRLTSNDCTACLDPTVLYYNTDPCSSDKIYCDPNSYPVTCPEELNIVCAYTDQNCVEDSCSRPIVGACAACQDPAVIYYTPGVCNNTVEQFECSADICAQGETGTVCGYFTENCDQGLCSVTVETPCEACSDPGILYYTAGVCETTPDNRTYCLPNNRPNSCDGELNEQVCGYIMGNCPEGLCPFVYENACSACQDTLVQYYIPGGCSVAEDTTLAEVEILVPGIDVDPDSGEAEVGEDSVF